MYQARLGVIAAGLLLGAAQAETPGKLVPGCEHGDVPALSAQDKDRYCRWVVRYRGLETVKTPEQVAVEGVLGEMRPAQPPQIDGDRASVLVDRKPGKFAVVSLLRREGNWVIISIVDPENGKPSRDRKGATSK